MIFKNKKITIFEVFFLPNGKIVVFLQPQIERFNVVKNGGTVAQLVEQRTENPRVTGSIPVGTTKKRRDANMRLFFCFINSTIRLSCGSRFVVTIVK